jgi:hypothetical protein
MKLYASYRLSAISIILFCWTGCYAQGISSTELINKAREYDGKNIVYAGEVVGDVMTRGDFVWVNINDGENAIGVWLDKELAKEIQFTGSYHARGDRLEIAGVFHRNCIQHGGDMDIHAQDMRKISPGRPVEGVVDIGKRNLTFILLVILCLALIFARFRRGRIVTS